MTAAEAEKKGKAELRQKRAADRKAAKQPQISIDCEVSQSRN